MRNFSFHALFSQGGSYRSNCSSLDITPSEHFDIPVVPKPQIKMSSGNKIPSEIMEDKGRRNLSLEKIHCTASMVALRSCLGARALLLLTVLLCCLSFVMCAKPTCTDANLTGEYTRCLSLTDTRSLYFYYDGQCDPSQSLAPPSPISGLPCSTSIFLVFFIDRRN